MSNKIYIIYASTGSGHKSAAKAIEIALLKLKEQRSELKLNKYDYELLDILDYGLAKYNGNAYVRMLSGKLAFIHDITWRKNFTGRINWGGGTVFTKFGFPKLRKKFLEEPPICAICTHMMAANVAAGARALLNINFPIVSVPTDYETEGLWPHRETDLFCVADEWMKKTLLARRVEKKQIKITGIPCHPDFSISYNIEDLKKKFKLPQNKILLLCEAGASMSGPYLSMRKILAPNLKRLKEFKNIHMIIISGHDKKYRTELEQIKANNNIRNLSIIGYTKEMPKLLNIADYVLCKAGGLTITECLCSKTPMILIGKPYAQEKINTWMLDKYHISALAINEDTTFNALKELNDNGILKTVSMKSIIKMRKPNAAEDIALATLDLINRYHSLIENQKPKNKKMINIYLGNKPAHKR